MLLRTLFIALLQHKSTSRGLKSKTEMGITMTKAVPLYARDHDANEKGSNLKEAVTKIEGRLLRTMEGP